MHSALSTQHSALSTERSGFGVRDSSFIPHPSSFSSAFTLVEVSLAIAVVAIGLVGVLALFPLGLRATRGAADDTQMAIIGQDYVSYYQQLALTNVNYYGLGTAPTGVLQEVAWPTDTNIIDGVPFYVNVTVTNSGFPQITNTSLRLVSRVIIQVSRPGSKTNTYVTEVARYVQ
jgi:prepilin-type N-terminal cleavage/methylation domain-containing protein